MGFEVIDEHGSVIGGDRGPTERSPRAPEPYDLGEPPEVAPDPRSRTAEPPAAPAPGRSRAVVQRLLHLPAVLATAALVAGAVLGGYVVHEHGVGQELAQARSEVNAVAIAENQLVTGINGVRMATITVRVTNFGPRRIEPVLSPRSQQATASDPLIDASTPHPSVAANGGTTLVMVQVPLPCGSDLGPVRVPVRSEDRQVHELDVTSIGTEQLQQDQSMCGGAEPNHSYVTANLSGTVDRPFIRFTNMATQARRIWLQSDPAALVPLTGVTISMSPSLPTDIEPQGTLDLRLVVHVNRCVRDVASYESAQSWLGFLDTDIGRHDPPTDADWQNVMGAGIGSVVTAAMLRACR
ncbi:MAG TPA: hypothetical protein VFL94_09755 [Actinomycetales bacterium]|nr:hypothetical protein [Actinomycetales bacterium]